MVIPTFTQTTFKQLWALLLLGWMSWLPAAPRALLVGDSMSLGAFGKTLDTSLRGAGYDLYTSVTGGASPQDWLPEYGPTTTEIGYWEKTPDIERRVMTYTPVPKIKECVAKWKPDLVIIQAGTNMYSILTSKRRTIDDNITEFERILGRIQDDAMSQGATVYWITPPSAHNERFHPLVQKQMRLSMEKIAARRKARVFNSYSVTRFTDAYPGTDGIHYGPGDSANWARAVTKDLFAWGGRVDGVAASKKSTKSTKPGFFARLFGRKSTPPATAAPTPEVRTAEVTKKNETGNNPPPPPPPPDIAGTPTPPATIPPLNAEPLVKKENTGLSVDLVLEKKSTLKNLTDVSYRSCLGLFEYRVEKVNRGSYKHSHMRVAHLIVKNEKHTTMYDRPMGTRLSVDVELLSTYPSLEKVWLVDTLPEDFSLQVYVPKL